MSARKLLQEQRKGIADGDYVNALVGKWGPMIGKQPMSDYGRGITALLMENQSEHLQQLKEDATLSTNVGSFTKYIFPVLRRVFPNLIANQIVSVQPMNAPVGAVFNYEYRYGGRKGSAVPQAGISNNPWDPTYDGQLEAGDDMIKNFGMYYSSEYNDYDQCCTNTAAAAGALTQASANCRTPEWGPIRAPGTSGQRTFYVKAWYRALDASGTGLDATVVATLDATGSTTNLVDNYGNIVGTFDVATGNWSINAADSAAANTTFTAGTVIYFQYFTNSELIGSSTTGAKIPDVSLHLQMNTITAEPRKLKASWSVEAAEDLKRMHGLNAESELVAGISNEIAMEIDRGILGEIYAAVAHVATYAYAPGVPGELESIRRLITQIDAVSAAIHKSTLRAPGNFIVTSPAVCALLGQLTSHGDYQKAVSQVTPPSYGPMTSNFGIQLVGTLMNKYTVYQDPYQTTNDVIVGLRGSSYLDAGFVFAPYIPLQATPTFQDPDTLENKKGLWSRYATKLLRPEYYGKVTVTNLPTVVTTL